MAKVRVHQRDFEILCRAGSTSARLLFTRECDAKDFLDNHADGLSFTFESVLCPKGTHKVNCKRARTIEQRQAGKQLAPGWSAMERLLKKKELATTFRPLTDSGRATVSIKEESTGASVPLLKRDGDTFVVLRAAPGFTLEELGEAASEATKEVQV